MLLKRLPHMSVVAIWVGLGVGVAAACSATEKESPDTSAGPGAAGPASSGTGGGTTSGGGDGGKGGLIDPSTSSSGGSGGMPMNPCGTGCGDVELCDEDHLGFDDDCNGQVDEICMCGTGQAHFCFKG